MVGLKIPFIIVGGIGFLPEKFRIKHILDPNLLIMIDNHKLFSFSRVADPDTAGSECFGLILTYISEDILSKFRPAS